MSEKRYTDRLVRHAYTFLLRHPGATMTDMRESGEFVAGGHVAAIGIAMAAGMVRCYGEPGAPGEPCRYYAVGEGERS